MATPASEQLDRVRALSEEHQVETVLMGATDIDGLWRGKRVPSHYFLQSAWEGSHICKGIFGWDVADQLIPGLDYTGWERGYPDFKMAPDLTTFALLPWQPRTASVMCDFEELDGTPVALSPRQVLKNVLDRAAGLGYEVRIGYELEFYLFKETTESLKAKDYAELDPVTPGIHGYSMYRLASVAPMITDIVGQLMEYGIMLEAANTEYGPGQFEINMRYNTAMAAADNVVIFKQGVREISAAHGAVSTFMAKYRSDWPGNSGHIHQSLWANGANAFANRDGSGQLSDLAGKYAAGQVATMPEVTALMCPTVNSYKRKVAYTWAPTTATVGIDNRTTALRLIPGGPKACRIEHRLPGADANPYLAIAAAVAGGLYGIDQGVEPATPLDGNAYELGPDRVTHLPTTLDQAVEVLSESKVARQLLGDAFVDHFVATRRWELARYHGEVTDWERRRYFEMI